MSKDNRDEDKEDWSLMKKLGTMGEEHLSLRCDQYDNDIVK